MIDVLALFFPVLLSFSEAPGRRPEFFVPYQYTVNHYQTDTTTTVTSADSAAYKTTPVDALALIEFARTLKGTPYKYACSDPEKGFDCSGFVMYVFNHFQMTVPRSSAAFTKIGKEVDLDSAMPGDLILFKGRNLKSKTVGHVGIITQASDSLSFIHASSGRASVIETSLIPYYKQRFMKVIRLLE